jgi:hypothetical protein
MTGCPDPGKIKSAIPAGDALLHLPELCSAMPITICMLAIDPLSTERNGGTHLRITLHQQQRVTAYSVSKRDTQERAIVYR